MIHLVTRLPLPYHLTLCRTLHDRYDGAFAAWFADKSHEDFPFRSSSESGSFIHYLSSEGYWKFFQALRSDSEPVVILGGWSSPMTSRTLLMCGLLRIPIFIWADHPYPRKRNWLLKLLRGIYLRLLGRLVSGFLACGQPTLEHLVSLGITGARIAVFPCWPELPRNWSLPQGCADNGKPLRLLAIGRHTPIKQFNVAIEAVRLANQRAGQEVVELKLAGDGPIRNDLEELARSGGGDAKVIFTGWLETEEVYRELDAADALVVPSKFEPFGVVVLEAMATGRPVLASSGVVAALDRDNGTGAVLLHSSGDVECLAQQITMLANDRERLRASANAARAIAEQWPIERAVTILNDVLAQTKIGRRFLRNRSHAVEKLAGTTHGAVPGDSLEVPNTL